MMIMDSKGRETIGILGVSFCFLSLTFYLRRKRRQTFTKTNRKNPAQKGHCKSTTPHDTRLHHNTQTHPNNTLQCVSLGDRIKRILYFKIYSSFSAVGEDTSVLTRFIFCNYLITLVIHFSVTLDIIYLPYLGRFSSVALNQPYSSYVGSLVRFLSGFAPSFV